MITNYISTYENQDSYVKRRCTISANHNISELCERYLDTKKMSYEEALFLSYDSLSIKIKHHFYDKVNDEFSVFVLTENNYLLKEVVVTETYLDKLIATKLEKFYSNFISRKPSSRQIEYFKDLQNKLGTNIEMPVNNFLLFKTTLEHLIAKAKELDEQNAVNKDKERVERLKQVPATQKQIETLVWLYQSYSKNEKTISENTLKNLSRVGADVLFNIIRSNDPNIVSELLDNYIATKVPLIANFNLKQA